MEYRQFATKESRALDQARTAIQNNGIYSQAYKREALDNLNALACAEIRCGAGVSENDPHYSKLNVLQAKGEQFQQTQQTDIYAKLKELGVDSTEEKTVRRGRDQYTRQVPLFSYGVLDASDDFIGSNEQISARLQQGSAVIGGTAIAVSGVSVATAGCVGGLGVGCVLGAPAGAYLFVEGKNTANNALDALNSDYVYKNGIRLENSLSEATHQEAVSPTLTLLTNVGLNVAGGMIAKRAGALVLREELPAVDQARNNARQDISPSSNVDGEMVGQDRPTYSGVRSGDSVGPEVIPPKNSVSSSSALDNNLSTQERVQALLDGAPGVNVTARADGVKYRTNVAGGQRGAGTAVTDAKAFEDVLGPLPASGNRLTVTPAQAAKLEKSLGLPTGRLSQGGNISIVDDVAQRAPRSPINVINLSPRSPL